MNNLIENAIDSISLGVEDYQASDSRRILSAVRNIHAGVLLLCKQVLLNASPDGTSGYLIYKKVKLKLIEGVGLYVPVDPHGETVDKTTIKERFDQLGFKIDWKRLDNLTQMRNEIEHFFMRRNTETAKEILASAMPLILELLNNHLQEDPVDWFDEEIWNTLINVNDVVKEEKKKCIDSFKNVVWPNRTISRCFTKIRCDSCGSSLVRQVDSQNEDFDSIELECMQCRGTLEREDIFEKALPDAFSYLTHHYIKDGGEHPISTCPECNRESWIVDDSACVFCEARDIVCSRCGASYQENYFDIDNNLCAGCSYVLQS